MSDLTEFLLARIAEDESLAERSIQIGVDGAALVSFGSPDAPPTLIVTPARMLAECEAKRKQIAHLIDFMEGDYAPWNEDQLRMMAAVYADHPDYRPEWRP